VNLNAEKNTRPR